MKEKRERLKRLEKKAIDAGLARYEEHLAQHGADPNMSGHSVKANAMYIAFRKLHGALAGQVDEK